VLSTFNEKGSGEVLTRCHPCRRDPCHGLSLGWAITIYLYVYMLYIRYFQQGYHPTYGHIRCEYTVLANPRCHGMQMYGTDKGLGF